MHNAPAPGGCPLLGPLRFAAKTSVLGWGPNGEQPPAGGFLVKAPTAGAAQAEREAVVVERVEKPHNLAGLFAL